MWAHNIARGTPDQIGPFLPITRHIRGITGMLGVSPNTMGINPEGKIREMMGLPAFDKWDDYRIDRMITNMAATGEISADEASKLLSEVERQTRGSLYCKVSQKGAISVYGLQRMPVTLYLEQWERLLDFSDDIRAFIKQNDAELKRKER